MIVKGPMLIPGIPDVAGEVLDEETIRKAALIIGFHSCSNIFHGKHLKKYLEI